LVYELERAMIPTMLSTAIQFMAFETYDDARSSVLSQVPEDKA
jgi:hypothetical protein